MLPFILFTLPAGVWVDRLRRRPILIAGDVVRAASLISIPVAYAAGVLSMPQLYVVGFINGIATVFFDVAYQSYLPALVERDQLVEGNSKLEVSRSAAAILGPGRGGLPDRGDHRADRDRRRQHQLPGLGAVPVRDPAARARGAQAGRRTRPA